MSPTSWMASGDAAPLWGAAAGLSVAYVMAVLALLLVVAAVLIAAEGCRTRPPWAGAGSASSRRRRPRRRLRRHKAGRSTAGAVRRLAVAK